VQPTVMIVEDDRSIREVVRFVLEDAGYQVFEAEHGRVALEVLRASSQRMIVLLDLFMPQVGSAAVLKAVAADEHLATHHAAILTTVTPQHIARRVVDLPPNLPVQYLQKPFELGALLDTVARAASVLQEEA